MKKTGTVLTAMLSAISTCILSSCMNNLGKAALTSKKLSDGLYYMEISGDDGFNAFLEQGGASSSAELGKYLSEFLGKGPFKKSVKVTPKKIACSAFIVPDGKGGYLAGRNYDWQQCTAMILKNTPDNGYASVSTVDLDFLGFGEGFVPEGMMNGLKALAGIYVPLDGINEKGLMVADLMAGDNEVTNQQGKNADLTTTSAIRLLLNYAATVDEAVNLLGKYNMHSDIGTAHHLFAADSTGKAVVIEWVNGVMNVKETNVLTNHYLTGGVEKAATACENSTMRFNKITDCLAECNNVMNKTQVMETLEKVKASNYSRTESTQWSVVYDLSDGVNERFFWRGNFENPYEILYNGLADTKAKSIKK